MIDYPLKFRPILKSKIWGGEKLKDILQKHSSEKNFGESWEISGVKNDISVVENGALAGKNLQDLISEYKEGLLGKKNLEQFGEEFPLLIKFIDAATPLSVQVHPGDEVARKKHDSFGKTEMWFILDADDDAEIKLGLKNGVTKDQYLHALEENKIDDLLNTVKVKRRDAFFIKAGTVHAIGAGVLLAEIQQTSDTTYRIYDYDRTDAEGKKRELHTKDAAEVINFKGQEDAIPEYQKVKNNASPIVKCAFFTTNFLPVHGKVHRNYEKQDSFVIFIGISGEAEIKTSGATEKIKKGESILIPAREKKVEISASKECELLEVYI